MSFEAKQINSCLARQLANSGSVTIHFSRGNVLKTLAVVGPVAVTGFVFAYALGKLDGAEFTIVSILVLTAMLAIGYLLDRIYNGKRLVIQ